MLVEAYWRYHQMMRGDRAQRLAADEHWWAVEAVEQMRTRSVGEVLELLELLLGAPDADSALIGAGPLEDLLNDRPEAAGAVVERCTGSEHAALWRQAVAAVWLTGYHHDRLPALAGFLSAPIDRA